MRRSPYAAGRLRMRMGTGVWLQLGGGSTAAATN